MSSPTFGSVFSGIGGFDLGLERAGWRCVWQVEIEPFCGKVLERRWPDVRRFRDVRTVGGEREPAGRTQDDTLCSPIDDGRGQAWSGLPDVDLLCGGFPCQDLSVAGKRGGLKAPRSGLFFEFARLASELRPRWLLIENVPGLYSSNLGDDFGRLLAELDERGFDAEWATLDSRWFGVPQRRRRVFIVGHLRAAGECPFPFLLESEGGQGDSPAGREAGAGVAAGLTSGSHGPGVNAPGRRKGDDENLIVGHALKAKANLDHREDSDNLVVGPLRTNPYNNSDPTMERQMLVTHALSAEGADASEDGTGQGTPLVTISPWSVRRLTPTECERLQGFPDGWTCFCGCDPYSTLMCKCPDSPRYRSLGNAVTVSVIVWIGERLMEVHLAS